MSVRWSLNGEMIASSSWTGHVNLIDFKTRQIIHSEDTGSKRLNSNSSFIFFFMTSMASHVSMLYLIIEQSRTG